MQHQDHILRSEPNDTASSARGCEQRGAARSGLDIAFSRHLTRTVSSSRLCTQTNGTLACLPEATARRHILTGARRAAQVEGLGLTEPARLDNHPVSEATCAAVYGQHVLASDVGKQAWEQCSDGHVKRAMLTVARGILSRAPRVRLCRVCVQRHLHGHQVRRFLAYLAKIGSPVSLTISLGLASGGLAALAVALQFQRVLCTHVCGRL